MRCLSFLSLLLLVACASTQNGGTQNGGTQNAGTQNAAARETTPDNTAAADPFALPPGAADSAPNVELVSAGDVGEAQLLRLHPQEGFTQRMIMSTSMRMAINMGQARRPVEMPTSHMVFVVRVVNTNADGLSRRELLLEEVRVDPGPHHDVMEAELRPLQGLTGVEIVDARGRTLYLSYNIPEGVSDATRASLVRMQDIMKQVQPPFPTEPVAVGARWEGERTFDGRAKERRPLTSDVIQRSAEATDFIERFAELALAHDGPRDDVGIHRGGEPDHERHQSHDAPTSHAADPSRLADRSVAL